ncbi:hypothetical protein ACIQXI_05455 [Lysinibacillus sp. NPDC097195]|uniref:hypothetical protein n=1 Tax=Lysinibacillus sp. NPDC097195 TaxID=3364141 RepID=UPI003820391C
MSYISDLLFDLDSRLLGSTLELMIITLCISTIIFLATKNQYISYLSSAPIYYFIAKLFYTNTHLLFIVLTMTAQALILLIIQKKQNSEVKTIKAQTFEG